MIGWWCNLIKRLRTQDIMIPYGSDNTQFHAVYDTDTSTDPNTDSMTSNFQENEIRIHLQFSGR